MSKEDEAREERITMDVVVDAYDSGEQAMGWYYYLDDKISFPFTASCIVVNKRNPLKLGEKIEVSGMAGEDYCKHDMLVDVSWNGKSLAIPLSQIKPLDADEASVEAIEDWHYWVKQGYQF